MANLKKVNKEKAMGEQLLKLMVQHLQKLIKKKQMLISRKWKTQGTI